MAVGFGLDADTGDPVEVHVYIAERFVITFRRGHSSTIERVHSSGSLRRLLGAQPVQLFHHLSSELHDQFIPYIDRLDDRLGVVEAEMLDEPTADHLAEITSIRQRADVLRRTLTPGRDLAARSTVTLELPGDTADGPLYASDIADQLRLIVSDLAAVSDRCISALGLHASLGSNRQAAASRQLAAVATVFLPVTFVVGFFGMNFDVLVNDFEQGWAVFLAFGVVLNVVCVVTTLWWLGRRGWR
jgi:magnesium transporter